MMLASALRTVYAPALAASLLLCTQCAKQDSSAPNVAASGAIATFAGSDARADEGAGTPTLPAADGGITEAATPAPSRGGGDAPSPASSDAGADAAAPVAVVGHGNAAVDGDTLSASITMEQVPPGSEGHRCVVVELPNTAPVWVSTLHATLTQGSHHLIVDRQRAEAQLMTNPQPCTITAAPNDTRLMIAQQLDTPLALPEGVAYRLVAHQKIFLQLHYINLANAPATITGKVELKPIADARDVVEAKSLVGGTIAFSLPAKQTSDVRSFLLPSPSGRNRRHVFAMTTHTHHLAVRSTIERVADLDAPPAKPLHESNDWAEPPLSVFATPLDFDGSDGLRLTCRYHNTTTQTVTFGESANDEMCLMWLYYYERDQDNDAGT